MGGNKIRLLALDQSTNKTGWCIFEDSELIDSGVIDLHTITNTEKRILTMFDEISYLISNNLAPNTLVCVIIEDTQFQSNQKTYKVLCRLQGMIESCCYDKDIPLKVVGPTKWRSRLGFQLGRGNKRKELKKQAINYVQNRLGDKYTDEDMCEAICIGFSEMEQ